LQYKCFIFQIQIHCSVLVHHSTFTLETQFHFQNVELVTMPDKTTYNYLSIWKKMS
jgi:hypothetical protein